MRRARSVLAHQQQQQQQPLGRPTVLAVQPWAWHGTQEELGAVCVGSRVGHAQQAWHIVLQRKVLIGELGTIDRFAARAITVGEVSTLRHGVCGAQ